MKILTFKLKLNDHSRILISVMRILSELFESFVLSLIIHLVINVAVCIEGTFGIRRISSGFRKVG